MENPRMWFCHLGQGPRISVAHAMPKTVFTGAHKHVVEILTSARKEAGLTQTQLGNRIGRDQSFISLIEGAQRRVDILEFFALARALGYEPLELVNRLLGRLDGNFEI